MATKTIRFTPFSRVSPTLDFALKNNLNVLFSGEHGVGKSSIIIETLKRHGLKYRYFSASTMDPYVDFVGIPMQVENEQGDEVIRCIRPEHISDDVEVFVFDEFNRSHSKIRNAVMELIQSKSINGRKFPNLKVVWAAINPSDHENSYDVEDLDPAQADRFHMHIHLPYEADESYFKRVHGATGEAATQWWKLLSVEDKKVISPRRLEYGVSAYSEGASADLVGVLFDGVVTNVVNSFLEELGKVSIIATLERLTRERSQLSEDQIRETLHDLVSTVSGRNGLERIYKSHNASNPVDQEAHYMWTIVHTPLEFLKSVMSPSFQQDEGFNFDRLMACIKKYDPAHPILVQKAAESRGSELAVRDMSDREYFAYLRKQFDDRNIDVVRRELQDSLRFVRYCNSRMPTDLGFAMLSEFKSFVTQHAFGKWSNSVPSKTYIAWDHNSGGDVSLLQMVFSPQSLSEITGFPEVDAKTRKRALIFVMILHQLMYGTRWVESGQEDSIWRLGRLAQALKYRLRSDTLDEIATVFGGTSIGAKTYFTWNDGFEEKACIFPFSNMPNLVIYPMEKFIYASFKNVLVQANNKTIKWTEAPNAFVLTRRDV